MADGAKVLTPPGDDAGWDDVGGEKVANLKAVLALLPDPVVSTSPDVVGCFDWALVSR